MNKGGTITTHGLRITLTDARHSSSLDDLTYLGEPAGFVVRLENGQTIYYAGDTCLFGDMKIIAELYRPDIAFLPIGDRFTMGPDTAAIAATWLGVKQVVPMHWGTFPLLTGTPAQLKEHLAGSGIEVLELAARADTPSRRRVAGRQSRTIARRSADRRAPSQPPTR